MTRLERIDELCRLRSSLGDTVCPYNSKLDRERFLRQLRRYKDALSEVIDREENNAYTVNPYRWIPVTERLPEVGDTYIVTIEYKGMFEGVDAADFVFTGDGYIDGKWDTLNDWIEDKPEFYHVTAWMPLPEPYTAESEE